jgi:hypothetical protein
MPFVIILNRLFDYAKAECVFVLLLDDLRLEWDIPFALYSKIPIMQIFILGEQENRGDL